MAEDEGIIVGADDSSIKSDDEDELGREADG